MLLFSVLAGKPESLFVYPGYVQDTCEQPHCCPLEIAVLVVVFVCLFMNAALFVCLDEAIRCESALMQTDSAESTELE